MKFISLFIISLTTIISQNYTISRVQIIGNSHTKSEFIENYLLFEVGDQFSLSELKSLAKKSQTQLSNTFYFYQNQINVIPLKSNKAKVIIRISEGFLYRFGGGPYGLAFGKSNINGKGLGYILSAGNKVFSLGADQSYFFGSKLNATLMVSSGMFKETDIILQEKTDEFRKTSVSGSLGYAFTPMFNASVFAKYIKTDLDYASHDDEMLVTGASLHYRDLDNITFPKNGFAVSTYGEHYNDAYMGVTKLSYFTPVSPSSFIASKISAGYSNNSLDFTRMIRLNHFNGLISNTFDYKKNSHGYLFEVMAFKHVYTLPYFGTAIYINGFYQNGALNNEFNFSEITHSAGIGSTIHIPYPVNLRIEAKYAYSPDGNKFLFAIGTSLGFLNEL